MLNQRNKRLLLIQIDNNMRLNFEIKTKLIALGFGLVTTAIVAGTILPTTITIKTISQETSDLKIYLEKKYQNAIKQRQSTKQIDNIKNETKTFTKYIYHRGNELQLITFFENIAAQNKLTQQIQAPGLDKPENQTLKISISLNGAYYDALQYLSDLETAPYFLVINRLQITSGVGRQKVAALTPTINMNLELQLYVAQ